MGTTNIDIIYRPVRIAFLVPEGDIGTLVQAAKINSLLWGGMNNPVLSIGGDIEEVRRVIDVYNADTIFSLDDSIDLDVLYDKYSQKRHAQFIGGLNVLDGTWQLHGRESWCLDLINITDHIWNSRTHAWPADRKGNYVKVDWNVEDPESPLFAVLFGAFPKPNSIFEQAFTQGLHCDQVSIDSDAVPSSIIEKRTLIELTTYKLQRRGQEARTQGVFVGSGSNFTDLQHYWNLRAAGIPLIFCNIDNLQRWRNFVEVYLETLQRRLQGGSTAGDFGRYRIPIFYWSVENAAIDALIDSLKIRGKTSKHNLRARAILLEPVIPFLQERRTLANVEKERSGYEISCELPPLTFVDPDNRRVLLQRFVALFSATTEFAFPLHTIRLPAMRDLLEDFGRDILFDPHAAVLQGGSIGLITTSFSCSKRLFPISYAELMKKVLAHVKIKCEASQSGIVANTIIEQLGGLEGSRVLKIRGVRKLIKAFNANDNFDRGTALKYIRDAGGIDRFKSLYINGQPVTADLAFEMLIKKGLVRSGLDLCCVKCRLSNWIPLGRIMEAWTCEYCGETQPIATLLMGPAGKWKYRKSGLFAKDNNQEGAIPVLLTLLQVKRLLEYGGFVYSTAVKLSGTNGVDCEVDLCILQYNRHEQASSDIQSKMEIGIGECKDEGGIIDEKDVQNLTKVYHRLNSKDIRCYIIFSKAADNFTAEEILLFKSLKKDGIPLILFTNNELEPYEPYGDRKETTYHPLLGNTLQEMSWMSSTMYLRG